jgi:deazaflavin-dependent oxidoreductase (nitroreductase family)
MTTTIETAGPNGVPAIVPILNPLIRRLLRIGMPMGPNILLTVRGRTSGEPRTFPVTLMEANGRQYVFATFGETNWVRNLRASGQAIVRRGRHERAVVAYELTPEEAAPVLRVALDRFLNSPARPLIRRWYELDDDSTPEDYLREARRHAGFELTEETR